MPSRLSAARSSLNLNLEFHVLSLVSRDVSALYASSAIFVDGQEQCETEMHSVCSVMLFPRIGWCGDAVHLLRWDPRVTRCVGCLILAGYSCTEEGFTAVGVLRLRSNKLEGPSVWHAWILFSLNVLTRSTTLLLGFGRCRPQLPIFKNSAAHHTARRRGGQYLMRIFLSGVCV